MAIRKLLIIIPNLGTGGAQKVFRQQMNYLSDRFDVYGCVFNWDGSFPDDRTSNMHSLEVAAGANIVSKGGQFLQRIRRLRALKRKLGIDITISHLEGADYVNILSRVNDKVVCWIHGTKVFDENITGRMGWLRKSILIPSTYSFSDRLVTVSEGIRNELTEGFGLPANKLTTIYNGFDIESIVRASKESIPEEFENLLSDCTLAVHCRFAVQKNLFALLRVFAKLKEIKRGVNLLMIGDGELRDELLRECDRLGLRRYDPWTDVRPGAEYDIIFTGYQGNPYRFLRHANLYLMTSGWEGFPLALCEAMACGLPVVSADCYTGPREILHPEYTAKGPVQALTFGQFGILLPLIDANAKDDIENTARSVAEILNLPLERLLNYSKAATERVLEFSLSHVIQATGKLLDNL